MTYVEEGPPRVLHVIGEVDLATVDAFRDALEGAVRGADTVIEMTKMTFIDAGGLRAILEVAESLNGAAPLTLVNAPMVERLFRLVDMAEMPSVEFRTAE